MPEHYWRLGLRTTLPAGLYLDADHTISSSLVADDANTIVVDAWGAGVTNLRLGWAGDVGSVNLAPFLGVNNLWDRQYVGSVTLNGLADGCSSRRKRAALRFGAEIGYARQPDARLLARSS